MKNRYVLAAAGLFALASPIFSQMGPPGPGPHGPFGGPHGLGPHMDHKLVLNAPYSANMSNEVIHHLADGTTITRTTTGQVARDSEGRTYEQFTIQGGPMGQTGPHTMIFISDPVAGFGYMLDSTKKVAVQRPLPPKRTGNGPAWTPTQRPNTTESDLPPDSSSGVTATGKQIVHTIPAGAEGNDRAMVSTTQIWTSPDLQITVKSVRNDPFSGQSTYQLSNIVTKEPDPSLFTVPAGYTVTTAPEHGHGGPPPPQE